jgi:hypothetical protein
MPINFYGRVVDDNLQPVQGAEVRFQWTDISATGTSERFTESDAQGAFALQGAHGKNLGVYISKGGYHAVNGGRGSFDFADFSYPNFHQPDPNAPVLFYLRKQGITEVLEMGRISPKIPADGTPVRFDLLKMGTDSPDGQLEIAAVTNTERYPPQRYDWWASVSVPDGGLVEHNEEFPFEAPLEGYQTRVEFDMPVTSPEWKPMVKRTYFVKFGSPVKYGRIHVDLDGRSRTIFLTYWVNPSGSRNLEVGPGVPQPVP